VLLSSVPFLRLLAQIMNALTCDWNELGQRVDKLRRSSGFRGSAGNALYGIAEYIALPAAMMLAAPYLIHRLGIQQFGVWMLVSAIVGSMGTLSTGFGAATVKYVSSCRGRKDPVGVERVVRSTLTINLLLGAILASAVWIGAPVAVNHIFKIEQYFRPATIIAVRIGALLLLIRSAEGVFVSTLRAFERYGPAVMLNVAGRTSTIIVAVVLASFGIGIVGLMVATLVIAAVEMLLQMAAASRVAGGISVIPILTNMTGEVFSYGCFSWLQAFAAVVFSYADRLVVGALLGTTAIAYYTICVQATQPIHGLAAAGLNFLFPYLSFRAETETSLHTRHLVRWMILANIAFALMLCVPLAVFGKTILRVWMGAAFANETRVLFPILALAFGALATNVVPYYALLALGHIRLITILNLVGGAATIVVAALLIPVIGLPGAAIGRLLYGPITWISYLKLRQVLAQNSRDTIRVCHPEPEQRWTEHSSGMVPGQSLEE